MTSPAWQSVVPAFVAQLLSQAGYTRPSPVQVKAIPLVRLGVDVVVHARAGMGKTLVFAIATAEKALNTSKSGTAHGPRVLFIAPTREIALQGAAVLSDLSSACGMRVVTCIGGLPVAEDERLLRKGCDVVVGTPGRLAALMVDRKSLEASCIDMLVLDEADRLMESPFHEDVHRMVGLFTKPYQLVALSATFESPSVERLEELRSLQAKSGGKEMFVCAAMSTPTSVVHYRLECDDDRDGGHGDEGAEDNEGFRDNEWVKSLDEGVEKGDDCSDGTYARQLEEVFGRVPFRQAIVFCPSRKSADATTRALVAESHAAGLLSSDMDQLARIRALNDLRQYRTRILVCTDVASRGIDLPNVDLVCNVGRLPADASTLKHRIGRAGRFGQPGIAVTLVRRSGKKHKLDTSKKHRLKTEHNAIASMLDEALDFREYEGVKADVDISAQESVVVHHVGGSLKTTGRGGQDTLKRQIACHALENQQHDADHRLIMESSLFEFRNEVLALCAPHFDMIAQSCAKATSSVSEPTIEDLSESLGLLSVAFSKVEDAVDTLAPGQKKNSRSLGTVQSWGLEARLSESDDVLMAAMADRDALAREADMLERMLLGET